MGNFFAFFCVNSEHNFEKSVFFSLKSLKTPVIKPPVTVTECRHGVSESYDSPVMPDGTTFTLEMRWRKVVPSGRTQ